MRTLFFILFSLLTFVAAAQVTVVSRNNFNFVKGTNVSRSTDQESLRNERRLIVPQVALSAGIENLAFIFPPQSGVLLFKSKDLNRPDHIAGKLLSESMIRVDTAFHNQAYRSESDQTFSFDIVYALTINGTTYYTDFRPHDFIPVTYPLKDHDQLVVVAAQLAGYDMYADKGYPNHFRLAILNKKGGSTHLFHVSEELPFNFEKEFWEDKSFRAQYDQQKKELGIEIKGRPDYRAVWDGSKLKSAGL
jgi:hypothetical protein